MHGCQWRAVLFPHRLRRDRLRAGPPTGASRVLRGNCGASVRYGEGLPGGLAAFPDARAEMHSHASGESSYLEPCGFGTHAWVLRNPVALVSRLRLWQAASAGWCRG
jgi:hypothetical protein